MRRENRVSCIQAAKRGTTFSTTISSTHAWRAGRQTGKARIAHGTYTAIALQSADIQAHTLSTLRALTWLVSTASQGMDDTAQEEEPQTQLWKQNKGILTSSRCT
jgi:hypothetical protein